MNHYDKANIILARARCLVGQGVRGATNLLGRDVQGARCPNCNARHVHWGEVLVTDQSINVCHVCQ